MTHEDEGVLLDVANAIPLQPENFVRMIYLLTAFGLTPGGSSTVHIYTQTVHRTTQWDRIHRTEHT
jgi:hypothetical protein